MVFSDSSRVSEDECSLERLFFDLDWCFIRLLVVCFLLVDTGKKIEREMNARSGHTNRRWVPHQRFVYWVCLLLVVVHSWCCQAFFVAGISSGHV